MLSDFLWLIFALTGLFLALVIPIIGLVSLVIPKLFRFLGDSRKQICLKLFAAWIVGCVMLYFMPLNNDNKKQTTDAPKAQQEKNTTAKEVKTSPKGKNLEEQKADIERAEQLIERLDRDYGGMSPKMTLDEFNRIEMGMSHAQVKEIVGGAGKITAKSEVAGITTAVVEFEGSGSVGANANVTFQDGRVVAKAQYGLK